MLNNLITNIELAKKEVLDADVRQTIMQMRKVKSPVLNWDDIRRRNGDWERPEYDFASIERFADVESLLSQSFRKKLALFSKEGYDFVGQRPELVDYVKLRLSQIAWVSGCTERQLIQDIYYDLDRFSNSYVVKVRNEKASGGYKYVDPRDNARMKPIAGLFVLPAPSVEFKLNDANQVKEWRQYIPGTTRLYKEHSLKNVAHFYTNKKKGLVNGTPRILPVMEDIKVLRRIEENVELLVTQSIFPLIHYKVGTENSPARMDHNGVAELDKVIQQVQMMPPEGVYVTPERHEIRMIGTEGRALRVEAYLDYFKKRVLAGLSLSSVDIGEGGTANRNTADTMSRALIDEVKADQRVFEDAFQQLIINELLMEASEQLDISREENKVYLRFREIDYDTKIKKENHAIQKFLQNGITHTELRNELGLNRINDEQWQDCYFKLIDEPKLLIQAGANPGSVAAQTNVRNKSTEATEEDLQKAQGATESNLKQKGASVSLGKENKTVANRNRPENQHGIKSSSAKSIKDYSITDNEVSDLKLSISARYRNGSVDASEVTVKAYADVTRRRVAQSVRDGFREGVIDMGGIVHDLADAEMLRRQDVAVRNAEKYVNKLFNEITDIAGSDNELNEILNRIDSVNYRLRFIRDTEYMRSYNWGAVSALAKYGEAQYGISVEGDSHEEEIAAAKKMHNVASATFFNIPPWHPNSTLRIVRALNE